MRTTGYCYPWDVLETPGFLDRAQELGVDEVAVAVSYHSARAATPWWPDRSSVLATHAALYRPVRPEVWGDVRLRPAPATWVTEDDSAGVAVNKLRSREFRTAAWIVLTHNSYLGSRFHDVAVRNCFGEVYPWALCPARAEVRDYAAKLTAECLADLDVQSVVLEACGQMGAVHQHQHEKTDAVWSPAVARLLSVCCCCACGRAWAEVGADADEIRAGLRDEVRRLLSGGDLDAMDDALPENQRNVVLKARQDSTDALRAAVLNVIGQGKRVTLHAAADPWVTGALPGLTPKAPEDVDAVVLPCWQHGRPTVDAVAGVRRNIPSTVNVGCYVTAVGPNRVPDIAGYVRELGTAGAEELHLYHLGLAGPGRWADMRAAVAATG